MYIGIAQIIQESNTFSPLNTTIENFYEQYFYVGEEIIEKFEKTNLEINGMLDVLRNQGLEPVPLLATHGSCSGPLTRECFNIIMSELKLKIMESPTLDGLLLALHGSLSIEDEPDGESEILEILQSVVSEDIPIGVSLDLHGHITNRMLKRNVFFVGYQTYPHVDMYETGKKTAKLLILTIKKEVRPLMTLAKRPMIISPVSGSTNDGEMKSIINKIKRIEKDKNILALSFFMVQPWLDYEDLGFASLVCSDNDEEKGKIVAEMIADMMWEKRNQLIPKLTPLIEAIEIGLSTIGTTVIGDCGDAPSGGSAGDNPYVLRTLLNLGIDKTEKKFT